MSKLVAQASEAAKVKVRQARKAALDQSKGLSSQDEQKRSEKQVSKDACGKTDCLIMVLATCWLCLAIFEVHCLSTTMYSSCAQVQNLTNQFVANIEKLCSAKEKELQSLWQCIRMCFGSAQHTEASVFKVGKSLVQKEQNKIVCHSLNEPLWLCYYVWHSHAPQQLLTHDPKWWTTKSVMITLTYFKTAVTSYLNSFSLCLERLSLFCNSDRTLLSLCFLQHTILGAYHEWLCLNCFLQIRNEWQQSCME